MLLIKEKDKNRFTESVLKSDDFICFQLEHQHVLLPHLCSLLVCLKKNPNLFDTCKIQPDVFIIR